MMKFLVNWLPRIAFALTVYLIAVTGSGWFKNERNRYLSGNYIVYTDANPKVKGTSSQDRNIDIYYDQSTAVGSPFVFGGAQTPDLNHFDAWNQIQKVGVTGLRKDFFLEYTVAGTSISDYLTNKNNISDIKSWRTANIQYTKDIFHSAKLHNMQTTGIISYAPGWLTYTGEPHGVPKDWDIYEDIVKKLYRNYRNDLDNVEIWNEPSYKYFLDPSKSGLTREEAYKQIFIHATHAIREVDNEINDGKKIKIGGVVSHRIDDQKIAKTILEDPSTKAQLDFISFHNYGTTKPDISEWKTLLHQYSIDNLPISVTEWNYSPEVKNNLPQLTGPEAIPYTGEILMSFLSQGVSQANYYSLFPIDKSMKVSGHGYLAFYSWNNGKAQLLPQSNTWQLLSQTLSLGKGKSSIYRTISDSNSTALGFKNKDGSFGFAVTNPSAEQLLVTLNLRNLPISPFVQLKAFKAENGGDSSKLVSQTVIPIQNGYSTAIISAPPNSVIGILVSPATVVQYGADNFLHTLFVK